MLDGLQAWVASHLGDDGLQIIDDTGFPKHGTHSVGVARQYTGTLGKVVSCQVAVTVQFATAREVVGLDARLYLPESWTQARDRMAKAGVPDAVGYEPKWQPALTMLRRAHASRLTGCFAGRRLRLLACVSARIALRSRSQTQYVDLDLQRVLAKRSSSSQSERRSHQCQDSRPNRLGRFEPSLRDQS